MKTLLGKRQYGLAIILAITVGVSARAQTHVLEEYVETGLQHNLVLSQKNIALDKALLGLKMAKSLYWPSVDLQATYSTAAGGRNIPLPIGDLLNGVYTTLNQLTGTSAFPNIENTTINFLPQNYYDAKVRTTLPIIRTEIGHQVRIDQQQVTLQRYELDTYRRELVKQIKTAYFNYLNTLQAVKIYQSTLALAKEGLRVNQKLHESGKGLPAYILRANSEVAQAEAQLVQAKRQVENAQLYFNALLNRPGEAAIKQNFNADTALTYAMQTWSAPSGIEKREELRALQSAIGINEMVLNMQRDYFIPKLSGFLDLGSQAENFRFNNDSRYYMVGLQLDIPIFGGNRNRNKISQAKLDIREAEIQFEQVRQQLAMSTKIAKNNLQTAYALYRSAQTQLDAAQAYQRLIERGYRSGANTYIETVDARNQLTAARMAVAIQQYQTLIAAAELERETSSYIFKTTSHD